MVLLFDQDNKRFVFAQFQGTNTWESNTLYWTTKIHFIRFNLYFECTDETRSKKDSVLSFKHQ